MISNLEGIGHAIGISFAQKQINEKLKVSFDVINQLFLQSYKMTMNTKEVFEAQEKIRLDMV